MKQKVKQRVRVSADPCPTCGKQQIEAMDGQERWCIDGVGHETEKRVDVRPVRVRRHRD